MNFSHVNTTPIHCFLQAMLEVFYCFPGAKINKDLEKQRKLYKK